MTADEVPVPVEEKADLAAMLQDYIGEMAQLIGADPDEPYPYFDLYWSEPDSRWPFWLTLAGAKAGFALVRRDVDAETMQIAEFFVTGSHRRQGVGRAAARRLIARLPGRWQITQREANTGAIAFWHRVLDGFAVYEETTTETDAIRREQRFTVS
jgi:predicted acetyltransferase